MSTSHRIVVVVIIIIIIIIAGLVSLLFMFYGPFLWAISEFIMCYLLSTFALATSRFSHYKFSCRRESVRALCFLGNMFKSNKISRTYPLTINGICRYSGSAKDCQEYDCSKCVLSVSYPFIVVVPAS